MQTNNLEKDGVYTIMCALIVKGQTDSAICSSAPGYLINKLEEVFSEIEEWNNEHAPRGFVDSMKAKLSETDGD